MVSKRQKAALITLPLLAGVSAAEALITPRSYFSDPIYWAGLVAFGLFGAFLYGNMKSARVQKYSATAFGVILVGLALASRRIPETLVFGFGFLGLFVGLGLRILVWVGLQTRWAYCPTCQKTEWAYRKKGMWACEKGHTLSSSTRANVI